MNTDAETKLLESLEICEGARRTIEETQGYSLESKWIRLLGEMIKEQSPNEDASCSAVGS